MRKPEPTFDPQVAQTALVRGGGQGPPLLRDHAHSALRRLSLSTVVATLAVVLSSPMRAQVLTSQYDNARTGANLHGTTLTPLNVNVNEFGKLLLKDFELAHGMLKEVAHGNRRFIDPGATPTVSSNGAKNAIVWVLSSKHWNEPDRRPAVLYAFDAANLAHELYSSEENSTRDRAGIGLRFNIPTAVDGRVYVGAKGELDVYGLLSSPR